MEIKTEFLGMKMTKSKMKTTLDRCNRLDTPEERISELEYLQKLSKMDRGRKKIQKGRKRRSILVGFGTTPIKLYRGRIGVSEREEKTYEEKNYQDISTFHVNYECTDWRCPVKPSSRNMKKTRPKLIITKFLKNFERYL